MTVKWDDSKVIALVRHATARGVLRGANRVLEIAKNRILTGPKTGRIYGGHQASAPGESPANLTGRLVNSGIVEEDMANTRANVAFTAPEAGWMEFGNEKIEARPYLRPALAEALPEIQNDVGGEIRRVL